MVVAAAGLVISQDEQGLMPVPAVAQGLIDFADEDFPLMDAAGRVLIVGFCEQAWLDEGITGQGPLPGIPVKGIHGKEVRIAVLKQSRHVDQHGHGRDFIEINLPGDMRVVLLLDAVKNGVRPVK